MVAHRDAMVHAILEDILQIMVLATLTVILTRPVLSLTESPRYCITVSTNTMVRISKLITIIFDPEIIFMHKL